MGRTRSRRGKGSRRNRSSRQRGHNAAAATAATAAQGSPSQGPPSQGSPSKLINRDHFATLPYELKLRIVELACSAVPPSARDTSPYRAPDPYTGRTPGLPNPHLDITTALRLTLVSQSFYQLMMPILCRHVWLSRPSALASFHLALSTRPQLGSLVHGLHVGPVEECRGYEDPLRIDEGSDCGCCGPEQRFMKSSLRGEAGRQLVPRWWGQQWSRDVWEVRRRGGEDDSDSEPDPSSQALDDALHAAQEDIDVDLWDRGESYRLQTLSYPEYTTRVWEVQAAFDAYLVAMRIWEDAQDVLKAQRGGEERYPFYPSLVITGYPTSPHPQRASDSGKDHFVVSRTSLLQHLARPHSAADRFDHLLLFARSALEEKQHGYGSSQPDSGSSADADLAEECVNLISPTSFSLDHSLPNTATVSCLLHLLRSVLVLTRNMETLSLTGFLQWAISTPFKTVLSLSNVRSLSIGPPPQGWHWSEPVWAGPIFTAVEELRICGVRLGEDEVDGIFHSFPALRKLTWSVAGRYDQSQTPRWSITGRHEPGPFKSLRPIVDRLAGVVQALETEQEGFAISTSSNDGESTSTHKNAVSDPLPLVEVRLDSFDLQNVLESVKDPSVRLAWSSGHPLPNQARRLLLTENPYTMARPLSYSRPNEPTREDLYQEGREWWTERCARRGGASLG